MSYSFKDLSPFLGNNFYRLKQIDFNGDCKYSSIIRINLLAAEEIILYPNPVTQLVYISGEGLFDEQTRVVLTNLEGKLLESIASHESSSTLVLNMSKYEAGVYIMTIQTTEGTFSHKLIKE